MAAGSTRTDSTNCKWNFDPWLFEFEDAEPADTEGRLHYVILYKGLEHPRILVYAGVLEPIPCGS